MARAESLPELKHSAKLGKTFWVGWLGGWLRKTENKAKAQHSWGLGLVELGNIENGGQLTPLPVNLVNGDRLQRRSSCQKLIMKGKRRKENNDGNSCHFVVAIDPPNSERLLVGIISFYNRNEAHKFTRKRILNSPSLRKVDD